MKRYGDNKKYDICGVGSPFVDILINMGYDVLFAGSGDQAAVEVNRSFPDMVITDGDLRRYMEQHDHLWELTAKDVMCSHPQCIPAGILAAKALHVLELHSVNQLIVLDESKDPVGMVHVHDILKAGVA